MNRVFTALIFLGCGYALAADLACSLGVLTPGEGACVKGLSGALTAGLFEAVEKAAELALNLTGVMTLWLGLMKVAEKAGLIESLGGLVEPVMHRLFPEIPRGHPALSAMTLNLSANALGIGNAATPLGIKAMQELQKLNLNPAVATDAMCLFLAMHATSFTPLPTQTMALRQAAGAADPADIVGAVTVSTAITAVLAVVISKLFQRFMAPQPPPSAATDSRPAGTP